jgi:hypothetical protein
MSALRTLRRRHKLAFMIRDDEGRLVQRARIKPGTPNRRIVSTLRYGPFELSYHATKGHRCVRVEGRP